MSNTLDAERGVALQGKRILVVEDEALVSMLLEDALVEAGAMVLGPVISVPDALRLLDVALGDGGVSAAVLDLKLGGDIATGVADALSERGVPFLFVTGYGVCEETARHAVAPVLTKPFRPDVLVHTLEALLAVDGQPPAAEASASGV